MSDALNRESEDRKELVKTGRSHRLPRFHRNGKLPNEAIARRAVPSFRFKVQEPMLDAPKFHLRNPRHPRFTRNYETKPMRIIPRYGVPPLGSQARLGPSVRERSTRSDQRMSHRQKPGLHTFYQTNPTPNESQI
jgi:hypothetical protein